MKKEKDSMKELATLIPNHISKNSSPEVDLDKKPSQILNLNKEESQKVLKEFEQEIRKDERQKTNQEWNDKIDKRIEKLRLKHEKLEKQKRRLHKFLDNGWSRYAQTDDYICIICIECLIGKVLEKLKAKE